MWDEKKSILLLLNGKISETAISKKCSFPQTKKKIKQHNANSKYIIFETVTPNLSYIAAQNVVVAYWQKNYSILHYSYIFKLAPVIFFVIYSDFTYLASAIFISLRNQLLHGYWRRPSGSLELINTNAIIPVLPRCSFRCFVTYTQLATAGSSSVVCCQP